MQKELQDYLIHSIDLKNLKNALFFTSEKISRESLLYKKIEKKAVICEIPPKKSWENEQNLAEIAVEFAQKMNKKLSLTDAQKLIKHLDLSSINLQQELEKVALYVGDKLSIDWTDILKICTLKAKTSIWEYSSALLEKNSLLALKKLKIMLLEEQPALQIVRQLVKIFANSFKLCEMYDRRSSTSEILIQFPHLKGNLLHKETAKAQKFGFNSFKSALNLLFKLEVSLKTSSQDQNLLFTLFTHKICNL